MYCRLHLPFLYIKFFSQYNKTINVTTEDNKQTTVLVHLFGIEYSYQQVQYRTWSHVKIWDGLGPTFMAAQ